MSGYLTGNRKMSDQKRRKMRKTMNSKALLTEFLFDSDPAGAPLNRCPYGCRYGVAQWERSGR